MVKRGEVWLGSDGGLPGGGGAATGGGTPAC